METARPLIDSKKHSLKVELPDESVELIVDPLRLAQALSNLLMNAAKYTDVGGEIVVRARRVVSGVTLQVRDNGIGLHESSLQKVFEMFSQVEGALERSQGGLGIGLALVKGLVQLHGGSVEAESAGTGRGSTFTIRLPETCVARDLLVRRSPVQPHAAEANPPVRCRVLVADDNRDAAEALSLLLKLTGYDVVTAHTGSEALEVALQNRPQACLLDIGMPGMSGYDVARALRTHDWGRELLLVALTGWGQSQDVARAMAAGFDRHFTKPVDPSAVENVLAEFCRSRGTQQANHASS